MPFGKSGTKKKSKKKERSPSQLKSDSLHGSVLESVLKAPGRAGGSRLLRTTEVSISPTGTGFQKVGDKLGLGVRQSR